ncbi:hypothetical protein EGW08_019615 [Elysia chlorotica]|uniref:Uncharacterized protein n=1 Tax=Elysia chlorotica TaxID=188477 RepID=A0A433STK0_ELYCH|nr:hypothetical protein EGW08_019615 [Elysia chlorotica]
MNLKEQQLRESLTSSRSEATSLSSPPLKFPSDVSETEAMKTVTAEDEATTEPCTQETTLKTQLCPMEDSSVSEAAEMNTGRKTVKASETPSSSSEETERKKMAVDVGAGEVVVGGGSNTNRNSLERKRVQAARDRRRMASGGSTNSTSSASDAHHRIHVGNGEPSKTAAVKAPPSPLTRFEGGREQKDTVDSDKALDIEQTEQKRVSRDSQVSSESSARNAELSPSRANAYQRSQSENISSGSESPHRPPPRSNSEEKPQGSNRPVAKVRPMPAPDSPLPGKRPDGARPAPDPSNILSYSSEEGSEDEETDGTRSRPSSEEESETEAEQNQTTSPRGQGQTQDDCD